MNKLSKILLLTGISFSVFAGETKVSAIRFTSLMDFSAKINMFTAPSRSASGALALATAGIMVLPELAQADVTKPIIFYLVPGHKFVYEAAMKPGMKNKSILKEKEPLYPYPVGGNRYIFAPNEQCFQRVRGQIPAMYLKGAVLSADLVPEGTMLQFLSRMASRNSLVSVPLAKLLGQAKQIHAEMEIIQGNKMHVQMQFTPKAASAARSALKIPLPPLPKSGTVLNNSISTAYLRIPMTLEMRKSAAAFLRQLFFKRSKDDRTAATAEQMILSSSGCAVVSCNSAGVLIDLPLAAGTREKLERSFIECGLERAVGGLWFVKLGRRSRGILRFSGNDLLFYMENIRKGQKAPADSFPATALITPVMTGAYYYEAFLKKGIRSIPVVRVRSDYGGYFLDIEMDNTFPEGILP